jgi:hypothetical protein
MTTFKYSAMHLLNVMICGVVFWSVKVCSRGYPVYIFRVDCKNVFVWHLTQIWGGGKDKSTRMFNRVRDRKEF